MSLPPELIPPPPEPVPPAPPVLPRDPLWDIWDVVLIVSAGAFFLFFVSPIIVFGVVLHVERGSMTPAGLSRDPRFFVTAQVLGYALLLIFMSALIRLRYNARFWQTIRWCWPASLRWLGFAAGGAALAIAIQLAQNVFPIPPSLPIDKYFRDATDAWLMAGFGILVAPFMEELFYRGFLYPLLARHLGLFGAVVLTSIPFALMHGAQLALAWAPLLMLFLVSVVLTLTRAKTGSVAASVLVHMAYNTTLFAMLFFATDHFQHLEKAL